MACSECGKREIFGGMVQCDQCDEWTHYECAHLKSDEVEQILNFFCEKCEDEEHVITWRRKRASEAQKTIKDKEYHEVEDIIGHRETREEREFLVRWKGYSGPDKETWEPKCHLDGAIDLLQRYCRRKEIALSSVAGLLGASVVDQIEHNESNWVSMDAVINKFHSVARS